MEQSYTYTAVSSRPSLPQCPADDTTDGSGISFLPRIPNVPQSQFLPKSANIAPELNHLLTMRYTVSALHSRRCSDLSGSEEPLDMGRLKLVQRERTDSGQGREELATQGRDQDRAQLSVSRSKVIIEADPIAEAKDVYSQMAKHTQEAGPEAEAEPEVEMEVEAKTEERAPVKEKRSVKGRKKVKKRGKHSKKQEANGIAATGASKTFKGRASLKKELRQGLGLLETQSLSSEKRLVATHYPSRSTNPSLSRTPILRQSYPVDPLHHTRPSQGPELKSRPVYGFPYVT